MATNPMQRKARNSFLAGMLITLIVAVLVAAFLVYQIMGKQEEIKKLKAKQSTVYVINQDVESGNEVTEDMFELRTVITSVSETLEPADLFYEYDETTQSTKVKKFKARIDLQEGMIITPNMLVEENKDLTNDTRLMEYSMIELPTELVRGKTVDIRLSLPTGQDYIVCSKKFVEKCNLDTIWIKMAEDEILTLGNAIIESYIIEGAKLYATMYVEAGSQEASTVTYVASGEVFAFIQNNPNILENSTQELVNRLTVYSKSELQLQRNNSIAPVLSQYEDERNSAVSAGVSEEKTKVKASREEYLTELGEI